MTSNQVAYASVQVEKTKASETQRHNEAMESLQQETNRINDERNQLQKEYQSWLQLVEEMKAAAQRDNVDNQKAYQEAMININQQQVDRQRKYDEAMVANEGEKRRLDSLVVNETNRHNLRTENLSLWGVELEQRKQNLDKYIFEQTQGFRWSQLENERTKVSNDYALGIINSDLTRKKVLNEYNLGLMNIGISQRRNNLANEELVFTKQKWEDELKLRQSEAGSKWVNTLFPYILPTANSVLSAAENFF